MSLEGFEPAVLISIRFLISGGLLLAFLVWRGFKLPPWQELWRTAGTGVIIIGGGNGMLVLAERLIPSGLAAIFITLAPFWFVGIEALLPNGEKLHKPVLIGMFIGLGGAILLALPDESYPVSTKNIVFGALMLQVGSALWSFGSLLQRRVTKSAHPFMAGAIQQLAVGVVFFPAACWSMMQEPVVFQPRATWAMLYLIFFGGIVGYSSYIYALSHLSVAVVSIYNYINPLVAVALGWLFYREPFGWRETAAMIVIFCGVAIVKRFSPQSPGASIDRPSKLNYVPES
jgi:drug/metabolite transporter (DMT)-like permease